jgi:hypothetical protein
VKKGPKEKKATKELMEMDYSEVELSEEEDSLLMTRDKTLQPENYSPVESSLN